MDQPTHAPGRTVRRWRTVPGVALIAAALLVGCSADDEPAPTGGGAAAPPANATPIVPADPIEVALAAVNAQCPTDYPDRVTQLPEPDQLDALSNAELLAMTGSWSPAMRSTAANGLAGRGDAVVDDLRRAIESPDKSVRAGAASALSRVVSDKVRNWAEVYPDITDQAEAQQKIRDDYAAVVDEFIELTKDSELEVRNAALSALVALRPQTAEASRAVLALLWDEDEYLAANAMILFEKYFRYDVLERDELLKAIRQAMTSPFPRGKGHAMRLVGRMDDDFHRQLIPEYLAHLDWQPHRDTMFGAGGQAEALALCTKFKVTEVVPKLPALMTKTMRGPGLFEPCLESVRAFGKDSLVIVPELNAYAEELEKSAETANPRYKEGILAKAKKIREAVAYVQGL